MPELQIIGGPQSNYVRIARIACIEKGGPYHLVPVMPHTPEVDAIHPFGKIPVMRHDDATLSELRAICFYIDHAFDGPPLAPQDPVAGARTEEWISLVNTTIDPLLVRQYLAAYFFPRTPDGRARQWRRDRARIPGKALPALLHHQADRRGHRARSVDQLGHRHPAAWRNDRGRQSRWRVHRVHDPPAAAQVLSSTRDEPSPRPVRTRR